MGVEENKALMRRFHDELNKGNLTIVDEVFADDYVERNSFVPQPIDKAAAKGLLQTMYAAVPDMQRTIEQQVAEGDRVMDFITYRGTHLGNFVGIPPTGRAVTTTAMMISRIRDGRVVELWAVIDMMSVMQQIGAFPAPGGAA